MSIAAINNGYRFEEGGEDLLFKPFGSWIIRNLSEVEQSLKEFSFPESGRPVVIDLSDLEKIDVAGAWLIHRSAKKLAAANHPIRFESVGRAARILLQEVAESDRPVVPEPPKPSSAKVLVEDAGRSVLSGVGDLRRLIELIGSMATIGVNILRHPSKLRLTPILYHLEQTGVRAIPIVALITFVIGADRLAAVDLPAARLRRRAACGQLRRHRHPARTGGAADRDHGCRPLRQRVHRRGGRDEDARGD